MSDFDNLFDEALWGADDEIISTMGVEAWIEINGIPTPVRGVFDGPGVEVRLKTGGRIRTTAPTFFVKSKSVEGVKMKAAVTVNDNAYWVEKIDPDDTGSLVLTLAPGKPDKPAPSSPGQMKWSGNK